MGNGRGNTGFGESERETNGKNVTHFGFSYGDTIANLSLRDDYSRNGNGMIPSRILVVVNMRSDENG